MPRRRITQAQKWVTAYDLLPSLNIPAVVLEPIREKIADRLNFLGWVHVPGIGWRSTEAIRRLRPLRPL